MSAGSRNAIGNQGHLTASESSEAGKGIASSTVRVVRDLRLLMISIWVGAAVFFSFGVAPGVFAVLPTRELAGAVVSRSLSIINAGGFAIGLVLLVTSVLFRHVVTKRAFYCEIIALGIVTVGTLVGKWVIAVEMQSLRIAMGRPIDEVAQSDPLRIAFNNLHGYSVAALSAAMIAGIVSVLLIARRAGK